MIKKFIDKLLGKTPKTAAATPLAVALHAANVERDRLRRRRLMLTDLLYMYPSCVVTGTPTTFNNGAAKPTRHNNGAGVQCSAIVATALGAATPTLTVTYTDQGGVSGSGAVTASANSLPVGSLMSGGAAAQLGAPFMSLSAGDSGVRQLDSYTLASGTTGTVTFVLHRPIATIP